MNGAAFEAISTRFAWYTAVAVEKYQAVELDADGNLTLAVGDGQFMGIIQYGSDVVMAMVTAVKGAFPAVVTGAVTAGQRVTIDAANAGQFKPALTGDVVYGTALTAAAAGKLATIQTADVATAV